MGNDSYLGEVGQKIGGRLAPMVLSDRVRGWVEGFCVDFKVSNTCATTFSI